MENNLRGLDDWITGHYGEDQFKNEIPEDDDDVEYDREMDRLFEALEYDNTGENE